MSANRDNFILFSSLFSLEVFFSLCKTNQKWVGGARNIFFTFKLCICGLIEDLYWYFNVKILTAYLFLN